MRTAFIIVAIFAAVVLLVRFAAKPVKPRFSACKKLPVNTVLANIGMLGKECSVTQHGLGVGYVSVKIKRVIELCKKQADEGVAQDWQYVLCNAEETVINAFADGKKSMRQAAYCGHMGKYPRIYLFCDTLVNGLCCDITQQLLLCAVSAFEQNAPFTVTERKILCGVLKFCLIGYLYAAADEAIRYGEKYSIGIADGKSGKVDLDNLNIDDYVCGLTDGATAAERNSIVRLFEYNGVDVDYAQNVRRKYLAQVYVLVNSVLRSLIAIDDCKKLIYNDSEQKSIKAETKRSRKSYAKFFNFAFPILLFIYAVFTCIFASPKYVALFSVGAIITYGAMRIPILLQTPNAADIFQPIQKILSKLISRKKSEPKIRGRAFMSEIAYFGSEPQYIENTLKGELSVCCDNRGNVAVISGGFTDRLYIEIDDGKTSISLAECDGAAQNHRYTYRATKVGLELCAEVVAPIDISACLVKLTVVNRGSSEKKVKVTGFVVRDQSVYNCVTENITDGILAVCKNAVSMSLGKGAEYGGDLSAYCADGTLKNGYSSKLALAGVNTFSIPPFERITAYMAVVYVSGRHEAESLIKYAFDSRYYLQATEGAYIYSKNRNIHVLPQSQYTDFDCRITDTKTPITAPRLPEIKPAYALPYGGITDDGARIITDNSLYATQNNVLSNGKIGMRVDQFGIQNITYLSNNVTAKPHMYSHIPQAYIAIGENGLIWSPTVKPMGKGETYTVHNRGYTEYICAYNGTLCTQKCYTAVNGAVIVELTLLNKTNAVRHFDIMFSAVCDDSVKIALDGSSVTADTGGHKLRFFAVNEDAECAMYKEAYYIYGGIKKTSAFRSGGSTPAPTVSVNKTVNANVKTRVVFCIAEDKSELRDLNEVDRRFKDVKSFYARLGRVALDSDDRILNISYLQSLYCAYNIGFCTLKNIPLRDQSYILSAAKYVDTVAVKSRIYNILSTQKHDGSLGESYADCLEFTRCVIEYAEFTGDNGFWQEVLPFADHKQFGKLLQSKGTVIKHILKAIEYIIANFALPDCLIEKIWQCKSLLRVLRFTDDKIKSVGFNIQYKKLFMQAAEYYSEYVKRLAANNFFDFQSVTQAYMCARLLFDSDLNEKAYNIIKFNNPIERQIHYGARIRSTDIFADAVSASVYFTTVTEKLLGVKFKGKSVKINPHTAENTPSLAFDIFGKTKDIHIIVDGSVLRGSWKMRAGKISYFAGNVDIGESTDDIVFYRDGNG